MSTFQKTVFTVVLAAAFAGVPAISHGEVEVCYTDANKVQHCFVYVCLKPDVNTLTPLPVPDDSVCTMVATPLRLLNPPATSSRAAVLKPLTDGCTKAGGILEDKGSRVTCTLPGPKVQTPLRKVPIH